MYSRKWRSVIDFSAAGWFKYDRTVDDEEVKCLTLNISLKVTVSFQDGDDPLWFRHCQQREQEDDRVDV